MKHQLLPLDVGVTERHTVVRGVGLREQLDSSAFKPPDFENLLGASVEVFGGFHPNPCDFLLTGGLLNTALLDSGAVDPAATPPGRQRQQGLGFFCSSVHVQANEVAHLQHVSTDPQLLEADSC